MSTVAVTPDQDAVVAEVEIAAPPERVFQALVDPVQVRRWSENEYCDLTVWEMDVQVGGFWQSVSIPRAGKGDSHARYEHRGRILELKPPFLLAYTWLANFHEPPRRETIVRWELTPTAAGTRVKLTHSGLALESKAREGYSGGWPGVLEVVKKYLER
jgi:uncharacterized protein YndB with AHSA1/START domain